MSSTVWTVWKTAARTVRIAEATRAFGVVGLTALVDALLTFCEDRRNDGPSPDPTTSTAENSVFTATHTGHTHDDAEYDTDGTRRERCPECGKLAVSYASRVLGPFGLSRDCDGEEFVVSGGDYELSAHVCYECGAVLDIRIAEEGR